VCGVCGELTGTTTLANGLYSRVRNSRVRKQQVPGAPSRSADRADTLSGSLRSELVRRVKPVADKGSEVFELSSR
jgi:hypothetical protein